MDYLPDVVASRFKCNENHTELIEKLKMACSNSPLTGETRVSCVNKRKKQHYDKCNIRKKTIVKHIQKLSELYPDSSIETICKELVYKLPVVMEEYLKSTNHVCKKANFAPAARL